MRISVFGLGYVGTVSAGCLADLGHDVIGVDINEAKVGAINDGRAPIIENGLDELIRAGRDAGSLRATRNVAEAVEGSDMSWICVGTPASAAGRLDTSALERVCEQIGDAIRGTGSPHTVVVRSTALPGTTDDLLIPILEDRSGTTAGRNLSVCYHPEFMREGSGIRDFKAPSRVVIGRLESGGSEPLERLYDEIGHGYSVVPIRIAEMIKYADNAWHAVKIGFANEIGRYSRRLGIDGARVMALFCEDTHLNISTRYLRPGFAFGGSCLPKDLRALAYRAHELHVSIPLLSSILESNARHLEHAQDLITGAGNRRVGMLGLSFKPGTDDLRESPFVSLAEYLIGKGYDLAIYDRLVNLSGLTGANRDYLHGHIPHIQRLLVGSLDELLEHADTLVLGHVDGLAIEQLTDLAAEKTVIDLTPAKGERPTGPGYHGVCW